MGKSNVAEKIHTLMASANRNLFGMDLQTQFIAKKIPNGFNKAFQGKFDHWRLQRNRLYTERNNE